MTTKKQKKAAKKNIKKAQKAWQEMTPRQRALAQPEGEDRKKPGEGGEGEYYRIILRPKQQFTSFRYHDVGEDNGELQRLAGRRSSGSWDTHAWLVKKSSAHIEDDVLVADTQEVRKLFDTLGSKPKHRKADIFKARPRPNVPESEKPTSAQQKARKENIKKAQEARWDND